MSISKDTFEDKYLNLKWGLNQGTRSGYGSSLTKTRFLGKSIASIIERYDIKSVVDICGDLNWQNSFLELVDVTYIGIDCSKTAIDDARSRPYAHLTKELLVLDAVEDTIPTGELMLIRDVLGHLTLEQALKVIGNVKKSGFKYLLTTHFDGPNTNRNIETGQFYRVNIKEAPYNSLKIIENFYEAPLCPEGSSAYNIKQLVLIEL